MRPITYITPSHNGEDRYDVYRCENGSQAWNVAQGISEPTARVIAAMLAQEILDAAIVYEGQRCDQNEREALSLAADPASEYTAEQVAPWIEGYKSSRDDRIEALKARAFTRAWEVPVLD